MEEFCHIRDAIRSEGMVPVALYHSHLGGSTQPSFRDKKLPSLTGLPSLVLAGNDGQLAYECFEDVGHVSGTLTFKVVYSLGASHCVVQ